MTTLMNDVDVQDFLRGADFMSASGGGDPETERKHLLADVAAGKKLGWRPLNDFDDEDLLVCCCYSGSIAPETFEEQQDKERELGGGRVHERPFTAAVRLLEDQIGKRASGLVSVEMGGINGGAILAASSALELPLADADYAGRAIPELNATALNIHDAPILPFACVDHYDNQVVVHGSPSLAWTERIGKYLALSAFGLVACAFAALPVARVREMAIEGTFTDALRLGAAIRRAREAGEDPVAAAVEAVHGWLLFQGTITNRDWSNIGYMQGRQTLSGVGEFADHELVVWFLNENHVSWLDGKPWVTSPDVIEFCDPKTGEPLTNTYLEVGQEVAVVGARRRDAFDSEAGIATLGPKHFGFDLPFQGIEALVDAL
jgi:DUF917 family protein